MPSASPAGTQPAVISLAKILPGQVRGERLLPPAAAPGARTAVPMAVNSKSAEGKCPPGQPHAHHPVPAKLGALGDHPADGRVARLVHGLHQRAEERRAAPPLRPGH